MNEKYWKVPSSDGFTIYGAFDPAREPRGRGLVIAHGFGGHITDYIHKASAKFFALSGYDVYRVAFYEEADDARKFHQSTLKTYSDDLREALRIKCGHYEKLYMIGHSYGGPTIMTVQPDNARAVSLWDPSFDLPRVWKTLPAKYRDGKPYKDISGIYCLISEEACIEGLSQYTAPECLALSEKFARPIQVIHASECIYNAPDELSWHSAGHPANERHLIEGADHDFLVQNTLKDVLDLTLGWFERF